MPDTEVTFEHIRAAAERISPIAKRTPVMTSASFDDEAGVHAFFKCENLQKGGAFKIRGASNFVFSIPKEQLAKGVVAHSSGNHAQAVAIAAQFAGIPATLVMPDCKARGRAARGLSLTIASAAIHVKRSARGSRRKLARPWSRLTTTRGPSRDRPRLRKS
jgi:threonine dehydratase